MNQLSRSSDGIIDDRVTFLNFTQWINLLSSLRSRMSLHPLFSCGQGTILSRIPFPLLLEILVLLPPVPFSLMQKNPLVRGVPEEGGEGDEVGQGRELDDVP